MAERLTQLDAAGNGAWANFVWLFLGTYFGVLIAIFALLIATDPYDSGRFPALPIEGVSDDNTRTVAVSLGRSAKFDSAIFGNSHGQALDPERLSRATGMSFVQLIVRGANAPEPLAVMRWFIRHHLRIGAIVVAADNRWCMASPHPWNYFPFWLYADSNLEYLANFYGSQTVASAWTRVRLGLGLVQPLDPRGFQDYMQALPQHFKANLPPYRHPISPTLEEVSAAAAGSYPSVDELREVLAVLPTSARVVIVFPPQFSSVLPEGPDAARFAECKARFGRLLEGRVGGGFIVSRKVTPAKTAAAWAARYEGVSSS